MDTVDLEALPLAGVKVVEFCAVAAGPFCGMLLADMGAEVWKVEPPEGDSLRHWPPHTDGFSENFASLNRNKRSVVLNLKVPADLALARALLRDADVLVENNRPGVMQRLGLGYDEVSQENPRLVYCSISAYGQEGPRAQEGGFDLTIQAASGVMSVTGEPDGPPAKCGVPIADFASGLYAAYAIAAALRRAQRSGIGAHIDVPMLGCTLGIAALQTSQYFGTEVNPVPLGSAHPRNAPYQAYQASDGYFAIAAGNDNLWRKVCEAVQIPALHDDERFRSTALRAANQKVLLEILQERFKTRPIAYWLELFRGAGVPHSKINSYEEALDDAQVRHMQWVQDLYLPNGAKTRTFGPPVRLDGKATPLGARPPALGQNDDELRQRVGTAAPIRD